MQLQNKVALITGASGALGSAIARRFAQEGASVALHYFENKKAVGKLAKELEKKGIPVLVVKADVKSPTDVEQMVSTTAEHFGRIDVLVNNAGIARDFLLLMMPEREWDNVIGVDLNGPFYCMKAVSPLMIKQKSGKIINVASVTGLCGQSTRTNYGAAKAALLALTRTVARDLASSGIYVNAIAPGVINAGLSKDLPFSMLRAHKAMTPVGRLGRERDIANTALFLASDQSDFITGEVITVSGGEVSWYL